MSAAAKDTLALLLVHVPPVGVPDSVTVCPIHTVSDPVTTGNAFTVVFTVAVRVQELLDAVAT